MKSKIKYTDEAMGSLTIVKDFLPPPEELMIREENVKVTLSLSKNSVEFFKKVGKKNKTPYQKMIRRVLDYYTDRFQHKQQ